MLSENSSTKVKVCHVTSAHPRYDVRIFHKECKSLANHDFDVTLLVNDHLLNESVDGVQIVSTQMKPKNRFERMVKSRKIMRMLMLEINADIYHFHDPELLLEAAWIKKKGKKVIFDFHEDVSQQILYKTWIPLILRRIISSVYKNYEQHVARKLDALVSVTPKFIVRLSKINSNTVMITNYPILRDKNDSQQTMKRKAVCFAGGISPQWNHENIIRAIESIDDIEYILAGSGPQDYINQLKSLVGWKKVNYLGKISHEKVSEIYRESMIGMTLLSNNTQVGDEGTLGNTKIFEFMEAKLPVICSNNKLWSEIIDRHQCGIAINPNNVDEIRDSIVLLINDRDKSIEMGLRGISAVESEFNWKIMELDLINLYYGLINN